MRASTYSHSSQPSYLRVTDRALTFSNYLREAFNKPILLAYLAISTYEDGDPRGWEEEQARVIGEMMDRSVELPANGVFGSVYLEYYDDAEHGGFFGEAEKYWGLIDLNSEPKMAFEVWKEKSGLTLEGDSDYQGKVLLDRWRLRLGDGSRRENFPERAGV